MDYFILLNVLAMTLAAFVTGLLHEDGPRGPYWFNIFAFCLNAIFVVFYVIGS